MRGARFGMAVSTASSSRASWLFLIKEFIFQRRRQVLCRWNGSFGISFTEQGGREVNFVGIANIIPFFALVAMAQSQQSQLCQDMHTCAFGADGVLVLFDAG